MNTVQSGGQGISNTKKDQGIEVRRITAICIISTLPISKLGLYVQYCNFTCCFVWVRVYISRIQGVGKGAEGNILKEEGKRERETKKK
jgi:hypothetical protein